MNLDISRRRIARVRCIQNCIHCFKNNSDLPVSLCYVSSIVEYNCRVGTGTVSTRIPVYALPSKHSKKLTEIPCSNETIVVASGEELCNQQAQWLKVIKYSLGLGNEQVWNKFEEDVWICYLGTQNTLIEPPLITPVEKESRSLKKENLFGVTKTPINRWEQAVEYCYGLHLDKQVVLVPADDDAVNRLKVAPPNWSLEHDEELARFLHEHAEVENENLGSVRNYVDSIEVSTFSDDDPVKCLTDGNTETYWESDGNQGEHWVRLHMKRGTIIKKLYFAVDSDDDNYMPQYLVVMAGELENLKKINDVHIDSSTTGDICVLEEMTEHFPIIEVKIKECKDDGIDTRIHGIKIKSTKERDLGLSKDLFKVENLKRYPKLETYDANILYRRALILKRFVTLLDSVLHHIVPPWEFTIGTFKSIEVIKQLLPLSKKRLSLIEIFLKESETSPPPDIPKLYINRRAAADHRADLSLDPECTYAIFSQIFEGLKPRDHYEKPLDYRWSNRHDQWWECKFISEGIIDQGGGFRDSLSDLAEELCPSSSEVPVPLPFFIRSPNQYQDDSNIHRDMYIPNPSCLEFSKYEWIGQLMGACLRGRENLVLSLPPFIWKKLAGEHISWSRDFATIDATEVKLLESMQNMDKEAFDSYFGNGEHTFTCVLSNGTVKNFKPFDQDEVVIYENRLEYINLVQQARMAESEKQINAIQSGLMKVVPQAVINLLTWQELEKRITGDPEISLEALKRTTHYEDIDASDQRIMFLWEALSNFTNEDRSRFLRFVTGRRRLPASIYISADKGRDDVVDALPESSTCSSTLYLPNYTSAKIAEEKIHYAAYNCVAIDTDISPWDE